MIATIIFATVLLGSFVCVLGFLFVNNFIPSGKLLILKSYFVKDFLLNVSNEHLK